MIFPTGIFLLSNIFSNSNAVCAAFFFVFPPSAIQQNSRTNVMPKRTPMLSMPTSFTDGPRLATIVWWNSSLAAKATQRMPARNVSAKPREAVDVERKRNTDCKQTVLCHMSQLPHRVLILVSQFLDLLIIPSAVHDVVDRDENAARHFFTEL